MTDLLDIEHRVQAVVVALPPRVRALAFRVRTMPQHDRARAIGELWADERRPREWTHGDMN